MLRLHGAGNSRCLTQITSYTTRITAQATLTHRTLQTEFFAYYHVTGSNTDVVIVNNTVVVDSRDIVCNMVKLLAHWPSEGTLN